MKLTEQENNLNQRESLEARKVAELLGALPRVEAPLNFEFGVRARIAAAGDPVQASFLPFLKVAAPLSLVLLVTAFVIFYGVSPDGGNPNPVVEVSSRADNASPKQQPQVEPLPATGDRPSEPNEKVVREVADTTVAPAASNPRRATTNTNVSPPRGGNSFTITQEIANVVTPPGIPAGQGRNANVGGTNISVQQVFEMLSISAEQTPGGWLVRSTVANGIAGRSGIQPNDMIEAIDDKKIPSGGQLSGRFEMKTLTVRRAGKQIKLDLKN